MTAEDEIKNLVSRLNRWLDDPTAEDAHTIYHRDAVVHGPRGVIEGADEIIAFVLGSGDPAVRTQHLSTDILVIVDGDQATVTSNSMTVFFPAAEPFPPAQRIAGLRSAFTAARTQGGWRLTRAEITPLWHATQPVPASLP